MKHVFSFLMAAGCVFAAAAEEGIVANTSLHPYFDPPKPFHGKAFWHIVRVDPKDKKFAKMVKEPMTQASYGYIGTPILHSLFENTPPDNVRLIVREIELYSNGKNVAPAARVRGEAEKAEIRYAERVNDGDDSRTGISYSAPAKVKENQQGSYTFTFSKPVTVSSAVIRSGRERSEENNTFVHLAADFSIQVKDAGGEWKDIPGTNVKGNSSPVKKVSFAPVTVREIRVNITGQGSLMKRTPKVFTKYPAPDQPFLVTPRVSRPPYTCFEDSILTKEDLALYRKWKAEHPQFLGFELDEWDNDFLHIYWSWKRNRLDQLTKNYSVSPTVMRKIRRMSENFKTREGFMKNLKFYFDSSAESCFGDRNKMVELGCVQNYSHYAQEWGAKYCIMETTCNGYQRHQAQMYFVRGSARQYGNPWSWYIAPTLCSKGGYTDPNYLNKSGLGHAGGNGGFSPSMNKRDRYLAWLAGAVSVFNEIWPNAYCMDKDGDGVLELSPHGEVMKEWYSFITKNPDRGVSYAPVAIGMQWDHGMSAINSSKPFADYSIYRGDMMNEAVLRTLIGYKFGLGDQDWGMSETPYGDICDVILPAPPGGPVGMNVLKNYRVLFLCGTFQPDQALANRLKEYVRNGGTLAINVKQLGKFIGPDFTGVKTTGIMKAVQAPVKEADGKTAFALNRPYDFEKVTLSGAKVLLTDASGDVMIAVHRYGKGNVITTTPDHLVYRQKVPWEATFYGAWPRSLRFPFMDWLFGKFSDELLPVKVNGKIQYGMNILKDGLLVYLFNNEGVKKTAFTAQTLDESKRMNIRIDLRKLKVGEVRELRSGKKLSIAEDHSVTVSVGPGDVAVIKLKCGSLQ